MTTRFYIDAAGNYLGGFDGALPPAGAVEVPSAPDHTFKRWDGSAWVSTAQYDMIIRNENLARHDAAGLPRPVEDAWTVMLSKALIVRSDIPTPILNRINAKRALRGEPPL